MSSYFRYKRRSKSAEAVVEKHAVQIYKNPHIQNYRPAIYATGAPKILETLICEGHKRIVVSAPTGLGKTISINHILSNIVKNPHLLAQQHNGVLPKRIICETLTPFRVTLSPCVEYLTKYVNPDLFHYAMSGETTIRPEERDKPHVLIMTTGYANERANSFVHRSDYHYIYFVDEAHDTSKETSLAVREVIWKTKHYNNVQVVFSSATIDRSSPIVRCNPRYILVGDKTVVTDIPPESFPTGANVDFIFQSTPVGPKWHDRAIYEAKAAVTDPTIGGDIAIMCPSKDAINCIVNLAENASEFSDFNIYSLHSEVEREESDRAIKDQSKRKLIVPTNVIENSITIPGLDIMIEPGVRKVPFIDSDGVTELREVAASKANIIQSAGRVGRTGRRGRCVVLLTKEDYDRLPETAEPDILRAPLYYYLMQLIKRNLPINEILEDIDTELIERDLDILVKMEVVTRDVLVDGLERYALTPIGEIVCKIPLSLRSAICIAKAILAGESKHLYHLCLLCCYADMKGDLLYRPSKRPREDEKTFAARCDDLAIQQRAFESHDTFEFLLRIWHLQYLDPNYLKEHGVYERKLYELNTSLEQLISNLHSVIPNAYRPHNHEQILKTIDSIRESIKPHVEAAFASWTFTVSGSKTHTIHRTALTNSPHTEITALALKRYHLKYSIYKFVDFNKLRDFDTNPTPDALY